MSCGALHDFTLRTTLDDKDVSRRWRKQLCPYCHLAYMGEPPAEQEEDLQPELRGK